MVVPLIINRKKTVAFIIAVLVVVFLALLLRGEEDTWLCQNGQWVRHGNPSAPAPTGTCGKALETTQPGKGNAIETKRGDNFSVVLETNPSTGYSWEPNFDSSYIQLIDRKYIPSSQKTLVGAGGKETFNFRALKGGEVEITFSYMRPWEKKEERKMVYKIIIN